MDKNKKLSLPFSLVVIDLVGAMLVAWGVYLFVGDGSGVLYIAAGILLMLPLVIHLLNFTRSSRSQGSHNQDRGRP